MIFKKHHIEKILRGEKTATRRRSGRYHVEHRYGIRAGWYDKPVAHIMILRKYRQRLGDMTPEDAYKEGRYSLQGFQRVWEIINGSWDPDEEVWVYEFRVADP